MQTQWQVQYGTYWWDIPEAISAAIDRARNFGCISVVYTYDFGYAHARNFADPQTGRRTTIGRYEINFETMVHHNLDSADGVERRVRLVHIAE